MYVSAHAANWVPDPEDSSPHRRRSFNAQIREVGDRGKAETEVSLLNRLKPTDREIRGLALRETDPAQASHFAQITRRPVFALVAQTRVGLAVLPSCFRRLPHRRHEEG